MRGVVLISLFLSMLFNLPFELVLVLYISLAALIMLDTEMDGEYIHFHPLGVHKTKEGYTFKVLDKNGTKMVYPKVFEKERQAISHMKFFCSHPQPLGLLV